METAMSKKNKIGNSTQKQTGAQKKSAQAKKLENIRKIVIAGVTVAAVVIAVGVIGMINANPSKVIANNSIGGSTAAQTQQTQQDQQKQSDSQAQPSPDTVTQPTAAKSTDNSAGNSSVGKETEKTADSKAASKPTTNTDSKQAEKQAQTVNASIQTDKGEIVVALRPDLMPVTVENFLKLVNKGFYNGLTFHRVEDWVIQGGDPQGNGRGGPGWTIKLEINPALRNVKYAIAMARSSDPDSAGSQFYILKKDAVWLDEQYAVFGNVIKGQDVVDRIAIGDQMTEIKVVK